MKWIKGKPTEDGYYWVRTVMKAIPWPDIVRVDMTADDPQGNDLQWFGQGGCSGKLEVSGITHYMPIAEPAVPVS